MRQQATSITHDRAQALRAGMTACLDPKPIVELDGSQPVEQEQDDARRDAFFRSKGFRVLRFRTHEPLTNIDGVLTVIRDQIGAGAPPPQPSPGGGGSNTGNPS